MEVHSCKFIPWTPSPACAITRQVVSSSKDTLPKIAVARENGDIELWCYEKTIWIRERVFPGTSANRTRSIVWVDNLILISGLHGDIVKLDLGDPTQKPKVVESLPPVWMMSLSNNKSTIAFGCEDGSIRIFRLVDDFGSTNILFWKSLEHTDRVVSLCWDIMDKFLYSGDSRCMMKKWDVASGRVQLVFGKRSQAFVWTLVVLDAQTIACGTSWGGVQLWDTKMGTVVMEFRPGRKIPNADILAMAADVEGRTLYASGCNPTLAIIRETKQRWHLETTEPTMNWRKEFGQTEGAYLPTLPVPFDVRGMVYVANNLVWISAGGVINSIPCEKLDSSVQRPKSVAVGGIVPENRIISVSKTHGLVLSHEASILQLWRLGKAKENFVDVQHLETGAILDLAQDHSQVLQLSLKSKNVTSSSLSEDGRFIAACDAFSLKLFEISMQTTGHPIVNKVKVPAIAAVTCTFSHDSTKVFVGGIDSTTYILQITQQSKHLVATVEQQFRPDASEKLPVQHLSLNHDGSLLVSADSHNISIYDIKAAKCETLPRFEETISVLKFWNSQVENKETGLQSLLFIVTSVNKIFTFNTETKNLAEWPLQGTLGQLHYPTRIRSMTFNPSKPQLVLVSMKHLHFITVENQLPAKYSRVLSNSPLYGEFLYDVEFIGQNQLAIFGRTLTQLLEKLPPVLAFRKFAT